MLTTLLCTAALASAQTDAVDFSPAFHKGEVLHYELKADMEDDNFHMVTTFDIAVESVEGDRIETIVTVGKTMNSGVEMSAAMDPIPMTLSKNGVPIDGEYFEKAGLMVYVALMTTYLPATDLTTGEVFEFERKSDEFLFSGKGSYVGLQQFEGKEYSVLSLKSKAAPATFDPADLSTECFYDAERKRVAMTRSEMVVNGNSMTLTLTFIPQPLGVEGFHCCFMNRNWKGEPTSLLLRSTAQLRSIVRSTSGNRFEFQ